MYTSSSQRIKSDLTYQQGLVVTVPMPRAEQLEQVSPAEDSIKHGVTFQGAPIPSDRELRSTGSDDIIPPSTTQQSALPFGLEEHILNGGDKTLIQILIGQERSRELSSSLSEKFSAFLDLFTRNAYTPIKDTDDSLASTAQTGGWMPSFFCCSRPDPAALAEAKRQNLKDRPLPKLGNLGTYQSEPEPRSPSQR